MVMLGPNLRLCVCMERERENVCVSVHIWNFRNQGKQLGFLCKKDLKVCLVLGVITLVPPLMLKSISVWK